VATFLALLPVLLLLGLLLGARWSAAKAGMASAAGAVIIAVFGLGYGMDGAGLSVGLTGPLLEAVFTALTILWIVFPALAIHDYQTRSGATDLIGRWLAGLTDDPRVVALLVAWFFALFLEGAAGFGTPVALAAPLLVGLGFPPVKALSLALIGHAVGVSFGAVGTPIVPLVEATGLDPRTLSVTITLLHAALGWMMAALLYRGAGDGLQTAGKGLAWLIWVGSASAFFLVPAILIAWAIGPELPTLGGAFFGAILFVGLVRWKKPYGNAGPSPGAIGLLRAAMPYLMILGLVLVTRLVPPLQNWLREPTLQWNLAGSFGGTIAPLYHPGTMLSVGLLLTGASHPGGIRRVGMAAITAAARVPVVAAALVSVLLLARLMVHSGMIDILASAAATTLGSGWAIASPAAGVLGTFVTGSATASNILLGNFQYATALSTGLAPMLVTAGQGVGAAIGNIITPHNIVAGAATVGLVGREGEVMKRTLPACLLYTSVAGLLVFALSRFA
jgi:lactate permease